MLSASRVSIRGSSAVGGNEGAEHSAFLGFYLSLVKHRHWLSIWRSEANYPFLHSRILHFDLSSKTSVRIRLLSFGCGGLRVQKIKVNDSDYSGLHLVNFCHSVACRADFDTSWHEGKWDSELEKLMNALASGPIGSVRNLLEAKRSQLKVWFV